MVAQLESAPGQDSVFSFSLTLALSEVDAGRSPHPAAPATRSAGRLCILVADDNRVNRTVADARDRQQDDGARLWR